MKSFTISKIRLKYFFIGIILLALILILTSCDDYNGLIIDDSSEYILNIEIEGEGNTVPADGEHQYEEDTTAYLEVEAEDGWEFTGWNGTNGNEVNEDNDNFKILIDSDKEITAVFTLISDDGSNGDDSNGDDNGDPEDYGDIINFEDLVLESSIRDILTSDWSDPYYPDLEDESEPIREGHVLNITALFIGNQDLENLTGLEYLEDLKIIRFQDNENLIDISPIASLEELTDLTIFNTGISDLSPLSELENLERLNVNNTDISTLEELSEVISLERLSINNTAIESLEDITGLNNLIELNFENTEIDNISPLSEINQLEVIRMEGNYGITDISPLLDLEELSWINLHNIGIDSCSDEVINIVETLEARGQTVWLDDDNCPYDIAGYISIDPNSISDGTNRGYRIIATSNEGSWETTEPFGNPWSIEDVAGDLTITVEIDESYTNSTPEFWSFSPDSRQISGFDDQISFTAKKLDTVFFGVVYDTENEPVDNGQILIMPENEDDFYIDIEVDGSFYYKFDDKTTFDAQPEVEGLYYQVFPEITTSSEILFQIVEERPEGDIVYYHNNRIKLIDSLGNNERTLVSGLSDIPLGIMPKWSPDRDKIVFIDDDQQNIYTVNSDGSNVQLIGDISSNGTNIPVIQPNWVSDTEVMYITDARSIMGTAMLNIEKTSIFDTDDRENLVYEGDVVDEWLAYPDYSETNNKLLLNSSGNIYTGDLDQRDFTEIVDGHRGEWSPDGEKIVFIRSGNIYIVDSDGNNEIHLTKGLNPSWSPDGNWIVYSKDGTIYRIDAGGDGDPYQITEGLYPHWGN